MSNPNFRINDGKIEINIKNEWIEPELKGYCEIKVIGEPGANGVVVKGTHYVTGREDAIKIWLPRKNLGEVREEQYFAEIRKIASLNNKNIVTIYDAWIDKDSYFCSMEYINGQTLVEWLQKYRSKIKKLDMLIKIFSAINFYQSNGVIHGDIHSKNIIIDKNEEVHIIDFGTSSMSSYEKQSKDRENYLMYELVEKILGTEFSKSELLLKKYSLIGNKKNENDVRNAVPVLFSKTILEYANLIKFKLEIGNIKDPRDLPEVCEKVARGFYINIDYFYENMKSWCSDNVINVFPQIFYDILEEIVYGKAQNNANETEKILFLSLYVYYDQYKKVQYCIENSTSEKIRSVMNNKKNKDLINIIKECKNLFEIHQVFEESYQNEEIVYKKENELRILLHIILSAYYGEYYVHLLRVEYLQMEEIKLNKVLYTKIIYLSHVYRYNNGI